MRQLLRASYRETQFERPLVCDGKGLKVCYGFRLQHDHSRGPFKGGAPGRLAATGRDVAMITTWAAKAAGLVLAKTPVAIQGFGNGGFPAWQSCLA